MVEKKESKKTSLGINENIEALLTYVLGWLTGIIFLVLEKDNQFVRFHAMQSVVVFLSLTILSFILGLIPVINVLSVFLIPLIGLVLWIILMVKAYQGEKYKLPYAGDFAEKQLSK